MITSLGQKCAGFEQDGPEGFLGRRKQVSGMYLRAGQWRQGLLVQVLMKFTLGEHQTPTEWVFILLIGFQQGPHPPFYKPVTQMVLPSCQIHLRWVSYENTVLSVSLSVLELASQSPLSMPPPWEGGQGRHLLGSGFHSAGHTHPCL